MIPAMAKVHLSLWAGIAFVLAAVVALQSARPWPAAAFAFAGLVFLLRAFVL